MTGRKRLGTAGLLVALGLALAGAVSAQVRPDRAAPDVRPDVIAPPRPPVPATPGKDVAPVRGGQVCVVAYDDRNGNGRRDGGEGPLLGQSFTIANAAGAQLAQGATAGDGRFCTPRPLPFGDYRVRQIPGGGLTNTDPGPASPNVKSVSVRAEGAVAVLFGNCRGAACAGSGVGPASGSRRQSGQLGVKKTVVSTAPGGGYPATGLTAGRFPIEINCVSDSGPWGSQTWNYSVGLNPGSTSYSLAGLGSLCTVSETVPPGLIDFAACPSGSGYWEPPLIVGAPVTLGAGITNVTVTNRFVCSPPTKSKVCVTKYNDLNGDGVRQSTEPGLTGWTFTVKNANGATVTTLTSTSGYPACSSFILPPGNYTITENLPATGWKNTDPGGAAVESFTVAAGGTYNAVFGNFKLGLICVRKYNDVNGNGSWGSTSSGPEPFMTGVPFEVKDSSGQVVHTGLTAALGLYCTPSTLAPGVYTVTETVPDGWTNTQPGGAASITVTIPTPYGGPTEFRFGNQKDPLPGELCVEKYNDLNGDGDQDPGEGPLQGWNFTRSGGGMPSLSGSTGANGRWCPGTMLPPGTYTVTETMKSGWTSRDPGGLSPVKTAVVLTNDTTIVKFGNQQDPLPGELCVEKYNDANGNGVRDGGEGPLQGWTFTRSGGGMPTLAGATGANGRWCAGTELPPGSYTVTETMKSGWTSTDPGGATPVKTAVITPNDTITVEFGNQANGPNLTLVKTKLTAGSCHGSQPGANNCTFRFTITNTGASTYTGSLLISDTVTLGSGSLPVSVVTAPPGWNCPSWTLTPIVCGIGSVSIGPGATVSYDLQLFLNGPAPSQKNCAVLAWGGQQTAPACVQIYP